MTTDMFHFFKQKCHFILRYGSILFFVALSAIGIYLQRSFIIVHALFILVSGMSLDVYLSLSTGVTPRLTAEHYFVSRKRDPKPFWCTICAILFILACGSCCLYKILVLGEFLEFA